MPRKRRWNQKRSLIFQSLKDDNKNVALAKETEKEWLEKQEAKMSATETSWRDVSTKKESVNMRQSAKGLKRMKWIGLTNLQSFIFLHLLYFLSQSWLHVSTSTDLFQARILNVICSIFSLISHIQPTSLNSIFKIWKKMEKKPCQSRIPYLTKYLSKM